MEKKGCEHYERKCEIQTPCCKKWSSCRLCHDENYLCKTERMDRHSISKIRCLICKKEQSPKKVCENEDCKIEFSRYYCNFCKFWDDKENKEIYHCEKCKICRIGTLEDVYHCEKCDMCYRISLKESHVCKNFDKNENCVVCLEDFFYSRKNKMVLPNCSHTIHSQCFRDYIKHGNVNCPVCGLSLIKMKKDQIEAIDQMVEQTKEFFKDQPEFDIWCHGCMETSYLVKYNYYGMKCNGCGGYNTKPIKADEKKKEEFIKKMEEDKKIKEEEEQKLKIEEDNKIEKEEDNKNEEEKIENEKEKEIKEDESKQNENLNTETPKENFEVLTPEEEDLYIGEVD